MEEWEGISDSQPSGEIFTYYGSEKAERGRERVRERAKTENTATKTVRCNISTSSQMTRVPGFRDSVVHNVADSGLFF